MRVTVYSDVGIEKGLRAPGSEVPSSRQGSRSSRGSPSPSKFLPQTPRTFSCGPVPYPINLFAFRRMNRVRHPVGPLASCCRPCCASRRTTSRATQVRMFFKPEGSRLRVFASRAACVDHRDRLAGAGAGTLDLSRAEPFAGAASSHCRRSVDLRRRPAARRAARAAVMASLPSDRSFDSYESALAHTTGPRLSDDTEFVIAQGLLDVLFEYPIQSDRSSFAIHPNFLRLGVTVQTTVHFQPPDREARVFSLHNDPGFVRLDPSWFQAAWLFARDGFTHILYGADHLLFLFVLIIPFRNLRSLVAIVTSFTLAHSSPIASAYGMTPATLWFPAVGRRADRAVHSVCGARQPDRAGACGAADRGLRLRLATGSASRWRSTTHCSSRSTFSLRRFFNLGLEADARRTRGDGALSRIFHPPSRNGSERLSCRCSSRTMGWH